MQNFKPVFFVEWKAPQEVGFPKWQEPRDIEKQLRQELLRGRNWEDRVKVAWPAAFKRDPLLAHDTM